MSVASIVLFAIAVIILNYLTKYIRRITDLPPGPWGLPVVGYIPWLSKKTYENFVKLGEKYGGIFSVNLASETVVVLNDWPAIKATLVDQPKVFSGRTEIKWFKELTQHRDIVMSDGPVWNKQRNFVVQCLRNVGLGRKSMESQIQHEVNDLLNKLGKCQGQSQPMQTFFSISILKVAMRLFVDGNNEMSEEDYVNLQRLLFDWLQNIKVDSPVNIYEFFRHCPPGGFGYHKFAAISKKVTDFINKAIDKHWANHDQSNESDITDQYITKIIKNQEETGSSEPPFNNKHLFGTLLDLFPAGLETTDSTTLWGFYFLATFPDVQVKLQKELDNVIGRERLPTIDDCPRLPYLEATIKEVHRLGSVIPLSLPHRATATVEINGLTIPKDTTCIQNIYAVHRDPKLWKEPEVFNPERFIDEEGKLLSPPYLMPFSIGPRMCIGLPLAEMELKLIFGCILHRFNFTFPTDQPKPKWENHSFRVTTQPEPYSLIFTARSE